MTFFVESEDSMGREHGWTQMGRPAHLPGSIMVHLSCSWMALLATQLTNQSFVGYNSIILYFLPKFDCHLKSIVVMYSSITPCLSFLLQVYTTLHSPNHLTIYFIGYLFLSSTRKHVIRGQIPHLSLL